MDIQTQGENYEETPQEAIDESLEEEDYNDEPEIDTIFGIPKKFVIVGVAILFLLIIIVVITTVRSKKKEPEATEEAVPVEEEMMATDNVGSDFVDLNGDGTIDDQEMLDQMMSDTDMDMEEEAPVEEAAPADSAPADAMQQVLDADADATLLGTYGYTASEISLAQQFGMSTDQLVENAKKRQEEAAKEAMSKMSDTASPEYRNLMNYTYLGQDPIAEPVDQTTVESPLTQTITKTINTEYTKCPLNGMQLFLKCKVANGVYAWMAVSPARWVTLPDNGSIVIVVTYYVYGENTYIIDVKESNESLRSVEGD